MTRPTDSTRAATAVDCRRRTRRVNGPFEGRLLGVLPVPLYVHDLSVGGCLIQWHHEGAPSKRMQLEIDLPHCGWVTVDAETAYCRKDYGFAVTFVNLSDDVRVKLESVVRQLSAT